MRPQGDSLHLTLIVIPYSLSSKPLLLNSILLGVVRQITCNDISVGRNVDEILRLLKAHQFVEVSLNPLSPTSDNLTCCHETHHRNAPSTSNLILFSFLAVQKYGDVCPAGWQPGDAAMSTDPAKSRQWFKGMQSYLKRSLFTSARWSSQLFLSPMLPFYLSI